jgi:hypothetical protein
MAGENNLMDKQVTFYTAWIKEEILEPYYIEISDSAFDVFKTLQRTKEGTTEKFEDKEHVGCFTDFRNAIKRIAALKCYQKGITYTLNQYIKSYNEILKRIELTIPEIKL